MPRAPKAAAPVPEHVLKKRRAVEEAAAKRAADAPAQAKERKAKRQGAFKRAEQYAKEYRQRERNLIRMRRMAKAHNNFFAEPEAKLLYVVRIRGVNAVDPKTRKILQLMRLRSVNNGVFIKANKATANMLRIASPYITYGEPNLKSIRELIYKRGFGKINKQRVALSDNAVVENALGRFGIQCVEDLIHEIATVGPHFREANNFLWPFKLNSPKGGLKKKRISFIEGGDYGDREQYINKLIRKMN
mmetsp:Transcript_104557/g.156579  ORF Transcript_104557/g.156579 Transcript_104557/m.156579 type:complete len:246 (+) Transcript_104557:38-775(+)